jgi:carbamate kinase
MTGRDSESRLVLSLGGNALVPARGGGTIQEQFRVTRITMEQVADLLAGGHRVLITHGNGPIVGNILIRNEAARDQIPPMPLDVCGADSQGGIGYMIQQTLQNVLAERGLEVPVATVVTQVVVAAHDPAFEHPTKPIGPFYAQKRAEKLRVEKGWTVAQDSGRGWRRVVPSPKPVEIVEIDFIRTLFDAGSVVIAVGGGGIPVVRSSGGTFEGVEAVVDKDRAAVVLARSLGVPEVVTVTGVDRIALNFGKKDQKDLETMTVTEARRYLKQGHFPPGSMGPKIEAAIEFLEAEGEVVIVGSPEKLKDALEGRSGTRIVRG